VVSRFTLWYGHPDAPPSRPELRAGPVRAILDGADLRHVRVGGVELAQRVYVAVRDAPWNTIPATCSDWTREIGPDRFRVTFRASHRYQDIAFDWTGIIEGDPDGMIRYEMDGRCAGEFQFSKIGFNVHHALDGSVGRSYRAATSHGELRGVLPAEIDPQRVVDGTLSGMFEPYSELAIEVVPGLDAIVGLEGDLLELQDHRNWTDSNFKSYGTPLALGFPFTSTDGQQIRQVLSVRYEGDRPAEPAASDVTIDVGEAIGLLPRLGFGMPSHDQSLSPHEAELLRSLAPDHVRVDLTLREGEWQPALDRAIRDAAALGTALELAVFANQGSASELAAVADRLRSSAVQVARVLVYPLADGFSAFVTTTPTEVVTFVRDALQPVVGDVTFAGGTNQSFADVNRDRPSDADLGLCFSISPTVHAADDLSIVENLASQADVVRMARSFGPREVIVSPVTIATRFGPYPAGPQAPGDLPPAVDVRQASLLGAAWTVGSLAMLAGAGARSVTWYETTGWRGVIETDAGSPMPDRFPSRAGQVFPMYHVFADVAEWKGGSVRTADSSDRLRAVALCVENGAGSHVLVANVTSETQRVRVRGLDGAKATLRMLDETSAAEAFDDPAGFRGDGAVVELEIERGTIEHELLPFAIGRIDAPS
jgi:hypothetical protein